MKLTTQELDTRELLVKIELDEKQANKALRKAAGAISREINIPGFRKGKAPYEVVVRHVGTELFYKIAVEQIVEDIYDEVLKELGVIPYGPASIEGFEKEPLTITLKIPLPPEVDLGDYRSIRIDPEEVEVTDEDVNAVLRTIQSEQATWKSVDRPAQYEDLLVVDMELKIGDKEIKESESNLYLSPDFELLPGLNDELVGLSAGEHKEFTLRYPEHANSVLAGEEVNVSVKVHEVKEIELPPIDDDLAVSVGDYEGLEDLKKHIRSNLLEEYRRQAEDSYEEKAVEALMASATVKFPPILVDMEARGMVREFSKRLRERGLSLDKYLKQNKISLDKLIEDMRPSAEERIKYGLVFAEFIKREGIEVSEEEVNRELERLKREGTPEEQKMPPEELKEMIRDRMLIERALKRLVSIARGELEAEGAAPSSAEEAKPRQSESTGGEG